MAVRRTTQIFPSDPGFGTLLGTGVGRGIGAGLEELSQRKLNEMLSRQQSSKTQRALEGLGIPAETAAGISLLPQNLQAEYIKNMRRQQQQQSLQQLLSGIAPGASGVAQAEGSPATQQGRGVAEAFGGAAEGVAAPGKQGGVVDAFGGADIPAQQQLQLAQMRQKEALAEKKQAAKITAEEKKQNIILRREEHRDTAPYAKKLKTSYNAAVDSSKRLGRITELNEKGNLGVPVFNAALKTLKKGVFGLGIDMTGLMTLDAQELDKLSTDFLKNVKDIFGARITDREVALFLQTIPTLSQSQAGRRKVIENLESFDKGMRIKKRAYDKIIKENKGYRPIDIETQVEEMTAPLLEKLTEEFKGRPVTDESPRGIISHLGKGILWY